MTRIALCFPGQGSQVAGMADGLFDQPLAEELLTAASAAGVALADALRGGADGLRPTEIAQPALLFVEIVLADALPNGVDIVGVAGHSVGEYAAAVFAGSLAPADAMGLVVARGRAMAAMRRGTMTALVGAAPALAETACAEVTAQGGLVVVATYNAPGQVVLSGEAEAVGAAAALAIERGARKAVPLAVSGAFHSPLMAEAAAIFALSLEGVLLGSPRLPLVSNATGAVVSDRDALRDGLARQLVEPVRWTACVESLHQLGAEHFVEIGPGKVLTGLVARIAPGVPTTAAASLAAVAQIGNGLPMALAPA